MKYSEFVGLVRQRGRLENDQDAERAIESTLKTLAQRLYFGENEELAAKLPPEAGQHLIGQKHKKLYNLHEFYERVSQLDARGDPEARRHARAVLSVVVQTVTAGELEDVLDQLPDEFQELFTYGIDANNEK